MRRSSFRRVRPETQLEVLLLTLLVVYAVRTYDPSLELVLYTTRQFPYAPSGAGNLTTSWQLVFRTEISLSLERTPFEGQVVHDRSLAIERFPQTASHAKHLTTAPLIHNSELRLTLRPSLLRSAVNRGTRIITLQELSKVVAAAYIERTIMGTNPSPTVDVGLITSWVRPHRVRPVRWQIKDCQTTEPRTFDSGF